MPSTPKGHWEIEVQVRPDFKSRHPLEDGLNDLLAHFPDLAEHIVVAANGVRLLTKDVLAAHGLHLSPLLHRQRQVIELLEKHRGRVFAVIFDSPRQPNGYVTPVRMYLLDARRFETIDPLGVLIDKKGGCHGSGENITRSNGSRPILSGYCLMTEDAPWPALQPTRAYHAS